MIQITPKMLNSRNRTGTLMRIYLLGCGECHDIPRLYKHIYFPPWQVFRSQAAVPWMADSRLASQHVHALDDKPGALLAHLREFVSAYEA